MNGQLIYRNGLQADCPKCGSPAGKRCRTANTNRSTDTHQARWQAVAHLRWMGDTVKP
jgi:hypothetical protein